MYHILTKHFNKNGMLALIASFGLFVLFAKFAEDIATGTVYVLLSQQAVNTLVVNQSKSRQLALSS